jgi:sulfur relay (sulfurtransferase) DsrC/TusE family protein
VLQVQVWLKNIDEMKDLVAVMLAATLGESITSSYYQTIKYLTALYLLVSCLSGDALIRPAYKKEMLSMLFKDGHPIRFKGENGSLFH